MGLSKVQQEMLNFLRGAVEGSVPREFIYVSEWLGHFPFGVFHWVEINGINLSEVFPNGWQQTDLNRLEEAGFIVKACEWQDPNDAFHQRVTYAIA